MREALLAVESRGVEAAAALAAAEKSLAEKTSALASTAERLKVAEDTLAKVRGDGSGGWTGRSPLWR